MSDNWLETLAPVDAAPDLQAELARLAKLKPLEYEAARKDAAQRLGMRASVLDGEVKARRAPKPDDAAPDIVEDLEPWPSPVDGAGLCEGIRAALLAHVVFPSERDADAAALWIMGTYLMAAWGLWPKLLVQSPEKRCGKTTLLEVVEAHVCRGLMTSNVTAAALFRSIEKWSPTLLIDEADRFLRDNEEANGIINAGHTRRTARVLRTVERNGERDVEGFTVWAAMAIASIGSQMDTLEDRSIRIGLRRRLPSESVARLPRDLFERMQPTRRKLARWAMDSARRIDAMTVEPPPCGNDRARDNWTPLWRIAAALGGPWPDRAAAAYALKEASPDDNEDDSRAVMALRDVAQAFEDAGKDRMQSADIVCALVEMEDRPWAEWRHGKPITANALARLLKPLGVKPIKLRFGAHTLNGYPLSAVSEAFARYCAKPPSATGTPEQFNQANDLRTFQTGTSTGGVPVRAMHKPLISRDCSDVPVREAGSGGVGYDPEDFA